MTRADEILSAARCALFYALSMRTPCFRELLVAIAESLECEALLLGAKPPVRPSAVHRIAQA